MRRKSQWAGTAWSACWRWGPPIVWLAVISVFSTDAFSANETGRFLTPVLRWLLPGVSPAMTNAVSLRLLAREEPDRRLDSSRRRRGNGRFLVPALVSFTLFAIALLSGLGR